MTFFKKIGDLLLISLTALAITGCSRNDSSSDNTNKPDITKHVYSIDITAINPLAKGTKEPSLPTGIKTQYQATVIYSDNTVDIMTSGVEWSTSNDNASITASGLLHTDKAGDVIISASLGSITGYTPLRITDAAVTSITLTPVDATIPRGNTLQYIATATYNNNTSLDVSKNVTWFSSKADVATINETGLTSAVASGLTTVTATLGDVTQSTSLKIYNAGTVVTWGNNELGADSSVVHDQLTYVQAIFSSSTAFAALKQDGTIVTWGNSRYGGDSSTVQDRLTNVQSIFNSTYAFSALKQDGSVVTWGDADWGGDSLAIQDQLTNIQTIFSTASEAGGTNNSDSKGGAFAAIKKDGSVITWGHDSYGGNSSLVQDQLTNVQTVSSTRYAFAALKQDGSVVTWGDNSYGGNSSAVQTQLTNVQSIVSNPYAFAALKQDGSVVTWGNNSNGGNSSAVQAQLTNVRAIFSTYGNSTVNDHGGAFAALKQDGTIVTWGNSSYGGNSSAVQAQLTDVRTIFSNRAAFAALRQDGTVVTWGSNSYGGNSSAVQAQLTDVQTIFSNRAGSAFAALQQDGTVVTWGSNSYGGNSSAVQDQLTNVHTIVSAPYTFAAIKKDGSVVTWGLSGYGGNSSAVQDQLSGVQAVFGTGGALAAIINEQP